MNLNFPSDLEQEVKEMKENTCLVLNIVPSLNDLPVVPATLLPHNMSVQSPRFRSPCT